MWGDLSDQLTETLDASAVWVEEVQVSWGKENCFEIVLL